jgi:hypothetical protein
MIVEKIVEADGPAVPECKVGITGEKVAVGRSRE